MVQGQNSLDITVFPEGATGYFLDKIIRKPLWQAVLYYKHGERCVLGSYQNVYEGPHVILLRPQALELAMQNGFVTSN